MDISDIIIPSFVTILILSIKFFQENKINNFHNVPDI